MKRLLLAFLIAPLFCVAAVAQNVFTTPGGSNSDGKVTMCLNGSSQAVPCAAATPLAVSSTPATPAAGAGNAGYPVGATQVQNSATGTTAGATATLPASATGFTYLCGFSVSPGSATAAITISITTTGLASNQTLKVGAPVTAAGTTGLNQYDTFTPCLQSSAINTAITVVAGALGTGGVNQSVNAWGYQQ